jgi:hypothetical protein
MDEGLPLSSLHLIPSLSLKRQSESDVRFVPSNIKGKASLPLTRDVHNL